MKPLSDWLRDVLRKLFHVHDWEVFDTDNAACVYRCGVCNEITLYP